MGKHYPVEFKEQVVNDYKSGKYGGRNRVAKHYNISVKALNHWIDKDRIQGNQFNNYNRHCKNDSIDYKERYEILKKYQAFIKAQREKK